MYWYWYVLSISLTLVKYRYWIIVKKVTDYTRYLILDFRILNFMIRKLIQDMKKNLCSWMLAMKLFRLHCVKMMLLCNSGLICNGKYISKLVSIWNVFYWGQKNAKNVIDIVSNQNRCGITITTVYTTTVEFRRKHGDGVRGSTVVTSDLPAKGQREVSRRSWACRNVPNIFFINVYQRKKL